MAYFADIMKTKCGINRYIVYNNTNVVKLDKDANMGDIIDGKIIITQGQVIINFEDEGKFKAGDYVIMIPVDWIDEIYTSNAKIMDYGFRRLGLYHFAR